ncbi:MAG: carbamate kinase [bacterium]|nr:carbamate kinase [bacterium]
MKHLDILALGGNAILPAGAIGTIEEQLAVTRTAMGHVADLLCNGRRVVLTHGNGPIVGNIVLRNEVARDIVAPMPLDVCGADSQGGIGYMIQQTLRNVLADRGIKREVVAVITQVCVDENDPAFSNPVKPIGPYFDEKQANEIAWERGWKFTETDDGKYRRVVASPTPIDVVEKNVIRQLVESDVVVITVGGGGVPVVKINGKYAGREAVIDKDLASALLAREIGAERFFILTDVDAVYRNFGSDSPEPLREVTVGDVSRLHKEGHFPPGSMGSKIRAAIEFLEGGGKKVIISDPNNLSAAAEGQAGTTIVPGE